MKNKEFYRFYQTEPFLETVRAKKKQQNTEGTFPPLYGNVFVKLQKYSVCLAVLCFSFSRTTGAPLKTLCLSAL